MLKSGMNIKALYLLEFSDLIQPCNIRRIRPLFLSLIIPSAKPIAAQYNHIINKQQYHTIPNTEMASLCYSSSLQLAARSNSTRPTTTSTNTMNFTVSCTVQPLQSNNIKVVINGATTDIGRAAIAAVTKARGMELAGAIDSRLVGHDAGQVCGLEEALEVPILNDLTMVLGSISQSKATGVVVDFTNPASVYDNVKQASAFGLRSVVYVPKLTLETVSALSIFCEKASMGCLIAPTLSIGSVLLQQAAISASFHYNNVEIVESRADSTDLPSFDANQIAENLSNLGQMYNREDISSESPARGQILGEDGIRVHSLVLPGLPSSTTVHFSGSGEIYSLRHDITNVQSMMPGLIIAIRKVVRLKNLIYGLEKFL